MTVTDAKHAIPDSGNFDPTRLPHIWIDNRLRMAGLIASLVGLCTALMGLVIMWESGAGARQLNPESISGQSLVAWAVGAVLIALGVWWLARRDIIIIDKERVKVRAFGRGRSQAWELPLADYQGMALTCGASSQDDDTTRTWTTWTVTLHHQDAARSVVLYRRKVQDQDGQVFDHNDRLTKEGASTCETRATAHAIAWAEAMEIPMLIERDGELVEKEAPPALAWMPTF